MKDIVSSFFKRIQIIKDKCEYNFLGIWYCNNYYSRINITIGYYFGMLTLSIVKDLEKLEESKSRLKYLEEEKFKNEVIEEY